MKGAGVGLVETGVRLTLEGVLHSGPEKA